MQGAVINVSSVGAVIPASGFQAYGVAKAAQDKMTMNLAFEFASKGVRVNSVLPGERLFSASFSCKVDRMPESKEQSAELCSATRDGAVCMS